MCALFELVPVAEHLYPTEYYTDQDVEGEWKWINGSDSTFTDWGINESNEREPNGANALENYAHMNTSMRDGHWNDKMFGASTQCFFCEWDVIP